MKVFDNVDPTWLYQNYHDRKVEVLLLIPGTDGKEEWRTVVDVQRQHSESGRYKIVLRLGTGGLHQVHCQQGVGWFVARWEDAPEPAYVPRTTTHREIFRAIDGIIGRAQIDGVEPAGEITDYVLGLLQREGKTRG